VVQYLPYPDSCYYISSCPRTASQQCAQVGTTIAVDVPAAWLPPRQPVIPFRGTVNIETLGIRQALDSGGAIVGYHIDVYNGIGRAACDVAWSKSYRIVDFLSY